ncbi:MAG: hypothetical protein JWL96_577 [Sphingomonas bacterium]|uniref:DUF2332 domain-containing protein n=1 Tax=Sphingomonas bacterium TaxID=1895847 RepID=UPI00261A5476|nr:DUF2332 domain-containing protein [Sphingomonas bacterium]MDB5708507.1 hypothetical protein [Sphingomonas bacterium]
MASEQNNRGGFLIQEHYCGIMGAPIYARICGAIARSLTRDSRVGTAILDWPGEPTRDALPLRFMGGLHALVLAGADDELAALYAGRIDDPAEVEAALGRVLVRNDAALLPWLDGPPQTNEAGRSAALMTGLLEIARRHGPNIEILEIGSSAGLNLLIDRYRFDLGGVAVGPADAPVTIRPEWRGPPPPDVPIHIVSLRGCDVAPMDAADPAVGARLAAYVWPEAVERVARLNGAIAMVREKPVRLERADAADWVEARLAEPQPEGATRVLMHSVVWQYLPASVAARIKTAMEQAGAHATPERPLAWVIQEPDRAVAQQFARVRSWPGHGEWQAVATTHAHGAWIDTTPLADVRAGHELPQGSA